MSKQRALIRNLAYSALMAAIVFVATAYLPRVQIGPGYVHIGDAFIYIAAALLPMQMAMGSAAVGGALADALTGYIQYSPFTFVIKLLLVIAFSNKSQTIISKRNIIACLVALPITVGGYFLTDWYLYKNIAGALTSSIGNIIQAIASAIIFIVISYALDKIGFKKKINMI